jgi:hypothetical protein
VLLVFRDLRLVEGGDPTGDLRIQLASHGLRGASVRAEQGCKRAYMVFGEKRIGLQAGI